MSDVLKFEAKKTVNERLKEHLTESEEALRAALHNELVTRTRVDRLEALARRGLFGRLNWLVTGR
jgi:hypothetical protein